MRSFPLHLIPLFPLLGAATNLLVGRRLGKTLASAVALASVAWACVLGWEGFFALRAAGEGGPAALTGSFFDADWLLASEHVAGASLHLRAGLVMDPLSAVMVLVITTIGFLIHVYSTAYMEHDEGYSRYFGYLNLFTGAMLILVLGDSLPVTFVGWEGVGLCSYLLIGFWYGEEANASAGRKAFVVNRVGDFCFLLGMFMIFSVASTLSYAELSTPRAVNALRTLLWGHASYATFAGILLFIGATGKSAQVPLYIWLPDAMAGPTPVSALIHAATMVTAGVYMVARLHGVFAVDPAVLAIIACTGAFTALFAATMGILQVRIKKILAYSTISQLGFMFIGVGTATYTAGMFHLVTHAVFKAGLFLAAGSIMHAQEGEEDVVKMGGLRRKLPITHAVYLTYCLAIAGIPPFAGFFSKDAILAGAWSFGSLEVGEAGLGVIPSTIPGWPGWLGPLIWATGLLAAACTAFYMFRSYFLVFWGDFRGDHHTFEHAHESPPAMTVPLALLAAGSVLVGFLGVPEVLGGKDLFAEWLSPSVFAKVAGEEGHAGLEIALMGVAIVVSLAGIALAWALYGRGISPVAERAKAALPGLYRVVFNKYYVDELYALVVGRPLRWLAEWPLAVVFDRYLIDGALVNGSAKVIDIFGRATRLLQNGDVQRGIVGVAVGACALLSIGANWVSWRASTITRVVVSGSDVTVWARGAPRGVPLDYQFDFGDSTPPTQSTLPSAQHRYLSAGKHKLRVTVTDPRWRTSSSDAISISSAAAASPGGAGGGGGM